MSNEQENPQKQSDFQTQMENLELERLHKQESASLVAEQLANIFTNSPAMDDVDEETKERFKEAYKVVMGGGMANNGPFGPFTPPPIIDAQFIPPPTRFQDKQGNSYSLSYLSSSPKITYRNNKLIFFTALFSEPDILKQYVMFEEDEINILLPILQTYYGFPSTEELINGTK